MKIERVTFALGVLAGALIGGRAIKAYDWRTEWNISAPLPVVYEAMTSRAAVREWWPDMELVEDGRTDDLRVGQHRIFPGEAGRHAHHVQLVRAPHQSGFQPPGVRRRRHVPPQSRQRNGLGREGALGILRPAGDSLR
ncbi:MAG: hypothetical protein H0T74_12025 [Rubrobacteraceae bacterium]|nr:hypothetical protein [Rubrobacteraceae bacterium]